MSGFLSSGVAIEIGGRSFTLRPLTLAQLNGELDRWTREEPIRRGTEHAKRLREADRAMIPEAEELARQAYLSGLNSSQLPDWGVDGQLGAALLRTPAGILKQLWLMVSKSAAELDVTEESFSDMLALPDLVSLSDVMAGVNGVKKADPQKAAETAGQLTGPGSTPPSPSASATPPTTSAA